ncbi:DUF6507 family protein [Arthrobacter sp. zg-Y1171]|uniref:DUF6507 family protein n=1 Tax=Arthrobacter sp. zg-Y1171 TaxID=2964610 RepID=UPI00210587D5|nr:DUF6507 family protein [Arthrobacter sp. zg-Y1171]MCQ1996482.1 DUF6507 family protein [Arthrobacter sp. zg-Y1171]UWX82084.1 DUF6507 family protein [Arthrobacter sp. zg-Y1171]
MTYEILPDQIHGTLTAIAADGNAMHRAATDAGTSAAEIAGTFGAATEVASAFTAFWSPRDETAQRVSSLLFRKATAVAEAAQAFITADGEMATTATAALSSLPADYAPPLQRGHGRFLE